MTLTEQILEHARKVVWFRPCHFQHIKNNMRTALCSELVKKGKLKRLKKGKYAEI